MLNEQDNLDLLKKLEALNSECNDLKKKAEIINEEKEKHFKKKEELQKEIILLIGNIKNLKGSTDSSLKGTLDFKKGRDVYNNKVKELIARIKELRNKKDSFTKNNLVNLDSIKDEIKRLERSIEINAYTYDKEKKINERIKRLKKTYKENEGVVKLNDELRMLSNEIESAKRIADEFHKTFDEALKKSKEQGSQFMELSRKISLLKQEQKGEFEKFKGLKNDYINCLDELREKQAEIRRIKNKMNSEKKERTELKREAQKKELAKKAENVMEKLKKEGKLTKEDLLILQAEEDSLTK